MSYLLHSLPSKTNYISRKVSLPPQSHTSLAREGCYLFIITKTFLHDLQNLTEPRRCPCLRCQGYSCPATRWRHECCSGWCTGCSSAHCWLMPDPKMIYCDYFLFFLWETYEKIWMSALPFGSVFSLDN